MVKNKMNQLVEDLSTNPEDPNYLDKISQLLDIFKEYDQDAVRDLKSLWTDWSLKGVVRDYLTDLDYEDEEDVEKMIKVLGFMVDNN